jgi:hypothetical protein
MRSRNLPKAAAITQTYIVFLAMVVPTPRIRLGVAVPHALMKFEETKNYSIANQQISKKD